MKSRALIKPRSGTETAKSIKLPTKVSNAATANNTRRNQTPDAAETAVLAAVGVKPEEFSDTLASCDSSTGHIVTGQTGRPEVVKRICRPRRRLAYQYRNRYSRVPTR